MSCAEALRTQRVIDGEASERDQQRLARHVEACAECREALSDAARLRRVLKAAPAPFPLPTGAQSRVMRALDAEDAARERAPWRRWRPGFASGAIGGAAAGALAAALGVLAVLTPAPATIADQVTQAHTDALTRGRLIDVVSSDHHTVKPWFAGRAPLSPPVTDFAPEGYRLIGGRVSNLMRTRAAVLAYQHGRHEIDLFVWVDARANLPAQALVRGYRSSYWKRGDLDFAAVSDTAAPELARFVALARSAPE